MPSSPAIGVALVASWGVALCKGNAPSAACSAPPIIPVGTPGEAVAHSIFVWEPTLPGLIKEHQRSFLLRLPTNYYVAERDSDGDIDDGRVIPGPLVRTRLVIRLYGCLIKPARMLFETGLDVLTMVKNNMAMA